MSIESILYLIDFSENLNIFFLLISVFLIISTLVRLFFINSDIEIFKGYYGSSRIEREEAHNKKINYHRSKVKKYCVYIILFLFIGSLFPSEKTMYLMLGAHYLKKSDIPAKVELVLDKKLDEYLKDKT